MAEVIHSGSLLQCREHCMVRVTRGWHYPNRGDVLLVLTPLVWCEGIEGHPLTAGGFYVVFGEGRVGFLDAAYRNCFKAI